MVESIASNSPLCGVSDPERAGAPKPPGFKRRLQARTRPSLAALLCVTLCAAASTVLTGCGKFFAKADGDTGTGTGTGSTTDQLYIANNNANLNTIAGFNLTSGALTATTNSPYLLGQTPSVLALTPTNSLLYVGSVLTGIYVYVVNSDGSLTLGNSGAAVANVGAASIAIDPTGSWLLAFQDQVSGTAPVVSVFAINKTTGVLTTAGSPIALDPGTAGQLVFVPSTTTTNLVYASLGTGGIDALSFNTSSGNLGTLSVHYNTLGNAYSTNGLAVNPAGTFLYAGETGANGVRSFTINANGTLAELASSPSSPGTGGTAVLVDATGGYLYSADTALGTISAFSIGATGALTPLATPTYTAGIGPIAMVEDNTKGYLAVVNDGGTPDLEVFPLDATTGALGTPVTASTGSTDPAQAYAIAGSH